MLISNDPISSLWRVGKIVAAGCVIVLICVGGCHRRTPALASAADANAAAVEPGPAAAGARAVEQGRYLATVGNCITCHTRPGGRPFSGGVPFDTPLGTIYSTNITPDADTGIGK